MFNLIESPLAFIIVGLVLAVGVWLFVRAKPGSERANSQHSSGESDAVGERREMRAYDWFDAAVSVVIGVLLGVVIFHLMQLVTTSFWPIAILIPILFGGVLLLDGVFNRVIEKIFPSGIKPARKSVVQPKAPLPKRLSLPAGIAVGFSLALFGVDGGVLGVFA